MKADFTFLLSEAVSKPGILSDAYSVFHEYSVGNMMLAYNQLTARGIPLGPIATYRKWQSQGRSVKKGETAISLYMPVSIPKKTPTGHKTDEFCTIFMVKNRWFAFAQTEGQDIDHPKPPDWNYDLALTNLAITEKSYDVIDGNTQGYAQGNQIAINPVAKYPHKTRFHELAHVVLGHTDTQAMMDDHLIRRDIKEVEAECVAYICCSTLDLTGLEESRHYIQEWMNGTPIEEKSARNILTAANKILDAGKPPVCYS